MIQRERERLFKQGLTNLILQRWDLEFIPDQSPAMYYNPTPQRRHGYMVRLK